jgi:hypothetical protein
VFSLLHNKRDYLKRKKMKKENGKGKIRKKRKKIEESKLK